VARATGGSNGGSNTIDELTHAVSSLVRFVDRVWTDGTSVYVLLPECGRDVCEAMLARIREPLAQLLSEKEHAAVSSVVFPDDGVTAGALFNALNRLTISLARRRDQIAAARGTSEVPVA
jgi:hypothetical protein